MVDRKQFLTGAFALVSASALPARGADDPTLFATRGRWERLSLAYQHVHIGLEKPFSVLHISDTHLTEVNPDETAKVEFAALRRRTFGGRQQEAFADTLAWARQNVDYVIHTGDLIDFISDANLELVRKNFGLMAESMFGTTGNHEYQRRLKGEPIRNTDEYNALSRGLLGKAYPFDVVFQSHVVNGVNFIGLEQTYGFVSPIQVARFKAEAKKGLPIVLCMHVPFFTDLIWRTSSKFWTMPGRRYRGEMPDPTGDYRRQLDDATTRDFIAYLKQEPLLKAILAGHLHLDIQDRFSPTAMEYVVGGNFLSHGQEVLFT